MTSKEAKIFMWTYRIYKNGKCISFYTKSIWNRLKNYGEPLKSEFDQQSSESRQ